MRISQLKKCPYCEQEEEEFCEACDGCPECCDSENHCVNCTLPQQICGCPHCGCEPARKSDNPEN